MVLPGTNAAAWLGATLAALFGSGFLSWFGGDLREAEVELAARRLDLAALGGAQLGQTVPQLGYQHPQVAAPPASLPWVQVDLGESQPFDLVALVPAQLDHQARPSAAYGFPLRFRLDVSDDPGFQTYTPLYVRTESDAVPAGAAPVVLPAVDIAARHLRLTVTELPRENGWHFFALAEILVLRGRCNIALGAHVTASAASHNAPRWCPENLTDGRTPLGPPLRAGPLPDLDGLAALPASGEALAWMAVDLGGERWIEEVRLHPLHAWRDADLPGWHFPARFRIEVSAREDFRDAVVFHEAAGGDWPNPGDNPVTLRGRPRLARHVRVLCLTPAPSARRDFALSEIEVYADGENVARGRGASLSAAVPEHARRSAALLTDGHTSLGRLVELPDWLGEWDRRARLQEAIASLERRLPGLRGAAQRRLGWTAGGLAASVAAAAAALAWRTRLRHRRELESYRTRLAQDLHDEIGSNLAGMALLSETAAAATATAGDAPDMGDACAPGGARDWRQINHLARESMESMREQLWLMGAREESGGSLAARLRQAAARFLPGGEVRWRALPETFLDGASDEVRRQVFLVFKEALANAARHARARRVDIEALEREDGLSLSIEDDGCGFDPAAKAPGLGLGSLRARAAALGGSLAVSSVPGRGTRILLRAPLRKR